MRRRDGRGSKVGVHERFDTRSRPERERSLLAGAIDDHPSARTEPHRRRALIQVIALGRRAVVDPHGQPDVRPVLGRGHELRPVGADAVNGEAVRTAGGGRLDDGTLRRGLLVQEQAWIGMWPNPSDPPNVFPSTQSCLVSAWTYPSSLRRGDSYASLGTPSALVAILLFTGSTPLCIRLVRSRAGDKLSSAGPGNALNLD